MEEPTPQPGEHIASIHHEGHDSGVLSPFVPAIRVAETTRLVFISGVTGAPVDQHDHPHVPEVFDAVPRDIAGQVRLAFEHLDLALKAAGCTRRDVVSLLRFLTHVDSDQDELNRYQGEWFGGHIPTSTTVEVKRLATDPRLRLELSVIAAAPPAR